MWIIVAVVILVVLLILLALVNNDRRRLVANYQALEKQYALYQKQATLFLSRMSESECEAHLMRAAGEVAEAERKCRSVLMEQMPSSSVTGELALTRKRALERAHAIFNSTCDHLGVTFAEDRDYRVWLEKVAPPRAIRKTKLSKRIKRRVR